MLYAIHTFWHQNPALFYALSILYGFFFAISPTSLLLIPMLATYAPGFTYITKSRYSLAFLLLLISFLYAKTYTNFPEVPEEGLTGQAEFKIDSISPKKVLFGKRWIYKGEIKSFTPQGKSTSIAKNIPVIITLYQKKSFLRPPADTSYMIQGTLLSKEPGSYLFVPDREKPWFPIQNSYSFAETRFNLKQKIIKLIKQNIKDSKSGELLSGLATGIFEDRKLYYEFSRYGLQHIMAISGFHFSIIAAILAMSLRPLFHSRTTYWILIVALSSYFLLLGNTPSIMRAWFMIMIGLVGFLIQRRPNPLNSLGVAICAIIMIDPLAPLNLGFQLSVVITAAILLFYPLINVWSEQLFPKRRLSEMIQMNTSNQYIYIIVTFLRQMLSLLIAVNIIALPLTLYYFQKFSLLSLVYNLFFPFLVSISMFFLILSFIFYPIHGLIDHVNNMFTKSTLNFIYYMPLSLDYSIRSTKLSSIFLVGYLTLLFFLGIQLKYKTDSRKTSDYEWNYL